MGNTWQQTSKENIDIQRYKMSNVNIKQQSKRVEIGSFEIENEIIFNYFNKLPDSQRDESLQRAIYIGILALMEDRFSSFLAKTSNELGTELENLKLIFDMKKEIFYKTAVKGILAESEIQSFLQDYVTSKNYKDTITLTGTTKGKIKNNKTGDILCEIGEAKNRKIIIECKFDKSIKIGSPRERDVFLNKTDTIWSQLIEAEVNRDSDIAIIVLDSAIIDPVVYRSFENVGYIPEIGFIAIIDSQKGDYRNLSIAYSLSREMLMSKKSNEIDSAVLNTFIGKLIKCLDEVASIKNLVEKNIDNSKQILKQVEKSSLMANFFQDYIGKYLREGSLNKEDLLDFYFSDEIREKYKLLEKEINPIE